MMSSFVADFEFKPIQDNRIVLNTGNHIFLPVCTLFYSVYDANFEFRAVCDLYTVCLF